jgi:hypothetical protein
MGFWWTRIYDSRFQQPHGNLVPLLWIHKIQVVTSSAQYMGLGTYSAWSQQGNIYASILCEREPITLLPNEPTNNHQKETSPRLTRRSVASTSTASRSTANPRRQKTISSNSELGTFKSKISDCRRRPSKEFVRKPCSNNTTTMMMPIIITKTSARAVVDSRASKNASRTKGQHQAETIAKKNQQRINVQEGTSFPNPTPTTSLPWEFWTLSCWNLLPLLRQ